MYIYIYIYIYICMYVCHLDQYKLESMAHILNGCKEIKNNCSKRHDYVVEKIASELKLHCNDIYINKTV